MRSNRARSNRAGALLRATAFAVALAALTIGGLVGPPAQAADAVDRLDLGPEIGADVTALIVANDHMGVERDFRSLRGKRGLILIFSRSFDW